MIVEVWNYCSDTLPEKDGKYIIYAIDNGYNRVVIAYWRKFTEEWTVRGYHVDWDIVAWLEV